MDSYPWHYPPSQSHTQRFGGIMTLYRGKTKSGRTYERTFDQLANSQGDNGWYARYDMERDMWTVWLDGSYENTVHDLYRVDGLVVYLHGHSEYTWHNCCRAVAVDSMEHAQRVIREHTGGLPASSSGKGASIRNNGRLVSW